MSERRLIDLDNLLRHLNEEFPMNWTESNCETDEQFGYEQALNIVKEQPIIDPVKHGKWIWHDNEEVGDLTGMWGYHECSNCHFGTIDRLPYCGHCGAKMDLAERGCCENEQNITQTNKVEHCPKCGDVLHYSQGVIECRCGYWRFDKDDR